MPECRIAFLVSARCAGIPGIDHLPRTPAHQNLCFRLPYRISPSPRASRFAAVVHLAGFGSAYPPSCILVVYPPPHICQGVRPSRYRLGFQSFISPPVCPHCRHFGNSLHVISLKRQCPGRRVDDGRHVYFPDLHIAVICFQNLPVILPVFSPSECSVLAHPLKVRRPEGKHGKCG